MNPLKGKTRLQMEEIYKETWDSKDTISLRWLCQNDLYFLMTQACNRRDMRHDWIFARCREVQANPNGYLDLWARGHYKSSIITFGLTIQDILNDPEVTFGILSYSRPIAKAFMSQIKSELEINNLLQELFPEILYKDPKKEAPKWSLDDGITVKRQGNPKEQTVEAWGLVEGQPTSKHWKKIIYDDVVTDKTVTTPEQILKGTNAWRLSLNLGSDHPDLPPSIRRYAGTTYHSNDTYVEIKNTKAAKPRIYAATHDGTFTGRTVFLTQEQFDKKVEEQGTYISAAQLLLNPVADRAQSFDKDWLCFYNSIGDYSRWNIYITVDPASKKKTTSDYTVMMVIGLAPDNNYYMLHGVRDRMNLTQRSDLLFSLVRQWNPIAVGYEEYGMQCDREHIEYVQDKESYHFKILPLGGSMAKIDRIKRLVPSFQNHRVWLPRTIPFISVDGKVRDFMHDFIKDEYETFPVCLHDDMLDCMARILDKDLLAKFPLKTENLPVGMPKKTEEYDPLNRNMPVATTNTPQPSNTWREIMRS